MLNPVGIFGWDIDVGAKYLAIASLIKTVLYALIEAARILYACRWLRKHPVTPIKHNLVKVLKPTGFDEFVIGERLEVLGRYTFNPTSIYISLTFAVIFEIIWFLGVFAECFSIMISWFVVMGIGILIAIIEDKTIPSLSEIFILYQMWVMAVYIRTLNHLATTSASLI